MNVGGSSRILFIGVSRTRELRLLWVVGWFDVAGCLSAGKRSLLFNSGLFTPIVLRMTASSRSINKIKKHYHTSRCASSQFKINIQILVMCMGPFRCNYDLKLIY